MTSGLPRLLAVAACIGAVGCGSPRLAGPSPVTGVVGLASDWTPVTCRATIRDRDLDGLEDDCELGLAQAFAPTLIVSPAACNYESGALAGGYAFAVTPQGAENTLLISYAPGYLVDCGWSGPKCWLRWRGGCRGHWGDSEFIALTVEFSPSESRWVTSSVFLSAHCFGTWDSDCRWYDEGALEAFDWEGAPRSAPLIWVAEGKNANYPSASRCERAHMWFDTCERNTVRIKYPIRSQGQNVGEPLRRSGTDARGDQGCFTLEELGGDSSLPAVDAAAVECFGSQRPFTGWTDPAWNAGGEPRTFGSTPYLRYFRFTAQGVPPSS